MWRWARWLLAAAGLLCLLWLALLIEWGWSPPHALAALARSTLWGAERLATSVLSGWFLLLLILLPLLLPLARQLLPRTRSLEVGGLKLQFDPLDLATLAFEPGRPPPSLAESLAIPAHEMTGSDGPILDQPPDHPAYRHCIAELPGLFCDLSTENMHAKGEALRALEEGWRGEYLPELSLSVAVLRAWARRHQVRLEGYLSITLLFRHLMLFYHGVGEHAALLVEDLDLLTETDRQGFLRRPALFWVALSLTQQRRWAVMEQLQRSLPPQSPERTAVACLALLAQGDASQAAALAANAGPHGRDLPLSPAQGLLLALQSQALLADERPLEAVAPAQQLLDSPLADDGGLRGPLCTVARRCIARAALLLNWPQPLYQRVLSDEEHGGDPAVLQSLAVLVGRAGQVKQGLRFVRQAQALLGPEHGPHLTRAVGETLQWLERHS